MILALKTASDETELVLLPTKATTVKQPLDQETWTSGRRLSDQLLDRIAALVERQHQDLSQLTGLVVFRGPGSFTSLRIGITTANTLAYALTIPLVGATGDDWLATGLKALATTRKPQIIMPLYGEPPHTTAPKK